MKKVFYFLLFLIIPVFLSGEPLYFRSNSMGMTLEKISSYRLDEFEYVLTVEKEPDITFRVLRKEGEEIKKWEIIKNDSGTEEIVYEKGIISSKSYYSKDKILTQEDIYSEGILSEVRVYQDSSSGKGKILVYDGEGNLTGSRNIEKTEDGRIRRVFFEEAEQDNSFSLYGYRKGVIAHEWHNSGNTGRLFMYDIKGELVTEEEWKDNALAREMNYIYGEEGIINSEEYDSEMEVRIFRTYDDDENIIREQRIKEQKLVEEFFFTYEDGLITSKVRKSPGLKEKWTYAYDDAEELSVEVYFKNDRITKRTVITDEDAYYEEIYNSDAVPFLRVYYEFEQKVKEELIN